MKFQMGEIISGLKVKNIRTFLIGSTVRGTSTPESDTDVIVVIDNRADKEAILDELSENMPEAYKRFHTGFNVTVFSLFVC